MLLRKRIHTYIYIYSKCIHVYYIYTHTVYPCISNYPYIDVYIFVVTSFKRRSDAFKSGLEASPLRVSGQAHVASPHLILGS